MPVDLAAAEWFVLANARVLDRHRLAVILHGASTAPVLRALRAYRNPDGGFGHALEPDVRAPESEPACTLHALEVLAEIDELDDPMVAGAADWIATIADHEGGVPAVMGTAATHPHAPWMVPSDGGAAFTFAIATRLRQARVGETWLGRATEWCWARLADAEELSAYSLKFALEFLDSLPEEERALAAIENVRPRLDQDGCVAVPGGTADERLTPLDLSSRPGLRSRALFTREQVEADLARLEAGQQDDGGWTFDWLGWSPGQSVESRGLVTVAAIATLIAHERAERLRVT